MAETSDHAAAGSDTAANEPDAERINLPAIVTPQLSAAADGNETGAVDEPEQSKTAASPVRSRRFVMLAASVAFAAGFGSFVGSVSGSGLARFIYPPVQAPAPTSGIENTIAAMREIKLQLGGQSQDEFSFADVDGVTAAQRARRAAWLRGEAEP